MLRPQAPDPELLEWMDSEEGYAWLRLNCESVQHALGVFGEVKRDHECGTILCSVGYTPMHDDAIKADLRNLGISGVPDHWKREWARVAAGYKSA